MPGQTEPSRPPRSAQAVHACSCQQESLLGDFPGICSTSCSRRPKGNGQGRESSASRTNSTAWTPRSSTSAPRFLIGPSSGAPRGRSNCISCSIMMGTCLPSLTSPMAKITTFMWLEPCGLRRDPLWPWTVLMSITHCSANGANGGVLFRDSAQKQRRP